MNPLQKIQKVSRLGQILSKIVFIFCIIGAAGCVAGIVGLIFIPDGYTIGKITIHSVVEKSDDISTGTCYAAMAVAIVFCIGEAILAKIAERYFTHELAAGTPFTFEGAKEMRRLGFFTICIPVASILLSSIVYAVMTVAFSDVEELHLNNTLSIGLGIMFIVMSLLCQHGAELIQNQPYGDEADR